MKYICKTCGYKYDENTKNKLFKDLNETFKCPLCGSSKEYLKEDNNKNIDNENIKYKVIKDDNPCINRIYEKCINCGMCKKACENITGIKDNTCIYCGNCILNCPLSSLTPKYYYKSVEQAINDDKKIVIALVAPAVRVSLGEAFDIFGDVSKKIVTALKRLGFDYVFDATLGADLTAVEESQEILYRKENNISLPMFTSCCPSFVKYIKTYHKDLIKNLSSCKSPIAMHSAILKYYFKNIKNINKDNIVIVSITPCTSKKYEASIYNDTTYSITASELNIWLRERGINLKNIKNSKFDTIIKNDLGNSSILFGNSKGVTASIIRCLWYNLKGENIPKRIINYKPLKSFDKIKEIKITINKITFNMCCCYTISAFNELLKNDYYKKYDFIEVMACVNGCVGGGGTILCNNSKILKVNKTRANLIRKIDKIYPIKCAYQNKEIKYLYSNLLEYPNNLKAKEMLHTNHLEKVKSKL